MLRRMATQLVQLQDVERLSSRVIRILGGNPGKFTLQGTNTYVIGHGSSRILIDTGEGKPAWPTTLKNVLAAESAVISTCILTHWHHDHISGVHDLLSLFPCAKIYKHNPALHGDVETWQSISDGQVFKTDGATLRAVHCPGHTTDHMAFVIEEEDAMFTGDNVLGHGTAVFEDLSAYMASLETMAGHFRGKAYPGHGDVIEKGKSRIQEYIGHRKLRERQVVDVMGKHEKGHDGSWTSIEVVKVVYKDVPENLHVPAEGGVIQVLRKLQKDGRVAHDGERGRWSLTGSSSL